MKTVSFVSALLLTACVTINIYFPAAAAEQVADKIIKDIQSEQDALKPQGQDAVPIQPQSKIDGLELSVYRFIDSTLNILVSSAYAAGADLSVDTVEIRQLRAAMRSRFSQLKPFYSKGWVAIKVDGLLTTRGNIALKDRNKVKKLVAAENADREKLYRAIANANGHAEWTAQIKSTFATRWVSNAQPGWWYQTSNGSWKQK